ncbi:MAG: peptidylprolyl isomerase [Sediminispirochaetaceae bacterium]
MRVRKLLNIFTVSLVIFCLTAAVVFAGGKQEKPEDTQKSEQENVKSSDESSQSDADTREGTEKGTPIQNSGTLPAATVNGEPISQDDFEKLLGFLRFQYMQQGMQIQGPQLEQLKQAVLESLIDDELMYQIALEEGYTPSEEEIENAVESTKGQFENEEAYQNALKQEGMNEEQLRETLTEKLTRDKYEQEKFIDTVSIDTGEARTFYEENPQQFTQPFQFRSSHILVQVAQDATEEEKKAAMEKIEAARTRIEGGEEFSEVARDVSEGPSSANGGDLDYHQKGEFVPEFEEAALALEIGDISDVVETQFGYHIIKLTDRKEEQAVAFEEVEAQIEDYLLRVKAQEKRNSFLQDRKAGADITRNALNG